MAARLRKGPQGEGCEPHVFLLLATGFHGLPTPGKMRALIHTSPRFRQPLQEVQRTRSRGHPPGRPGGRAARNVHRCHRRVYQGPRQCLGAAPASGPRADSAFEDFVGQFELDGNFDVVFAVIESKARVGRSVRHLASQWSADALDSTVRGPASWRVCDVGGRSRDFTALIRLSTSARFDKLGGRPAADPKKSLHHAQHHSSRKSERPQGHVASFVPSWTSGNGCSPLSEEAS